MREKQTEYQIVRHAVCYLLMNEKGEILSISRGSDTSQWGLPGGKVEDGEDLKAAIVREMYEETGYVIANPEPVYTAFVPGEDNFICTTFIGNVVAQASDALRSEPYEGEVAWKGREMLLRQSPFAVYNEALFVHLNLMPPRTKI